jgi:hypothetical protein
VKLPLKIYSNNTYTLFWDHSEWYIADTITGDRFWYTATFDADWKDLKWLMSTLIKWESTDDNLAI